ncbi:MAG: hypothetical protein LC647_06975, partial [Beggiatoa sp.]|nr:hypothetical protein [Beggiatoa sp.]
MSTTYPARFRVRRSLAMAGWVFEFLPLMGGAAHLGVEAKALRVDTAHGGRWRLSCRDGLQAQHLVPRAWPERDPVGAGRRLQGPEPAIRIG